MDKLVVCEECGNRLVPASGCIYCPVCGWSPCHS